MLAAGRATSEWIRAEWRVAWPAKNPQKGASSRGTVLSTLLGILYLLDPSKIELSHHLPSFKSSLSAMATAPHPPLSSVRTPAMTASPAISAPTDLYAHGDATAHALVANTLHTLDQVCGPLRVFGWSEAHRCTLQRSPPSLQEILAAFTSKGEGDREMLFALLNAKAAEDNVSLLSEHSRTAQLTVPQRIAAERNLRRSLLEMYKGQPATSPSMYMPESQGYSLPSPPASSYRASPYPIRRASRSPSSSQSSDEAAYLDSRKRRRSHSPHADFRSHRQSSLSAVTRSDTTVPPSPYSSASSQSGSGSPRSREAMNIGSLLTASQERDIRSSQAQQVSYVRRDDDSGRRHT